MAGTNIYGELIRAQLQNSASDLSGPVTGLAYFNTTTGVKWYNGSAWKIAADLDSTQTFSGKTISGASNTITNVSLTTGVTGILPTANGGTGQNSTATFPTSGTVLTDSNTVAVTNKDIDGGTASNTSRLTIPKDTKANLDLLTRKPATLLFATDTNTVYVDYNSTLNELGGAGVSATITQASHGFTSSDLGAPLYLNGSTYTKAKADAANTAEVVGVIGSIIDANTFKMTEAGTVTVDTTVSGGALTVGTVYFLSPSNAGQITATEPSVVGHVSMPLGVAKTTSTMYLNIMRGSVVGGSNLRTTVSLTNNATTNVQNVSAYDAGELTGWVSITATTPLRFYVAAQFSKNGAASDWNLSYQTSGDTPPTGFSMSITSGGIIQIVMPSITGFSTASINYALNAPAVGTAFPLTVQASAVQGRTDGSGASSGYIGQVITAAQTTNISIPAGTGLYGDALSLVLTAGVWKIEACVSININGATFVLTDFLVGYSTTSGNSGTGLINGINANELNRVVPTNFSSVFISAPSCLVRCDGTTITRIDDNTAYAAGTTLYLKLYANQFSVATPTYTGKITATRIA